MSRQGVEVHLFKNLRLDNLFGGGKKAVEEK
jgi:hypothetical protein